MFKLINYTLITALPIVTSAIPPIRESDNKDNMLEVSTNCQNSRVYTKGSKSDICLNRLASQKLVFTCNSM